METITYEDRIVGEVFVDDNNCAIYYETIYDTHIDFLVEFSCSHLKDEDIIHALKESLVLNDLFSGSDKTRVENE